MKTAALSLALLVIGCRGPEGPPGPQGQDGQPGPKAENSPTRIEHSTYCYKSFFDVSLEERTRAGLVFPESVWIFYSMATWSSGDVFVEASLYGVLGQGSGASVFAESQNGSVTGGVWIPVDSLGERNGGVWRVSLNRPLQTLTVEYRDADLSTPDRKVAWTFTGDECESATF